MTTAYRHILVPIDGSPLSARAVKAAVRLAASQKAKVTAMHVIPAFTPPAYMDFYVPEPELYSEPDYRRRTQAAAKSMLAKVEKAARAAKVRYAPAIVYGGEPWKGIIRTARSSGCDLIVMASHGRRGIGALLLGSETHKVLTHSRTPVLVCR